MTGAATARGARAWMLLACVLAAGSLIGTALPPQALDWQPDRAATQAWRWWTGALVHWSPRHLLANLAGLTLVAALGVLARVPPRCTLAWLVAWPLVQLGLLPRPELAHYGGLSGVLHAGVVIAAWHLLWQGTGRARWIGAALLAGTAAKVLLEAPWGPVLRHPAGWDIAVAPLAHATGALAGAACALLLDRPAVHRPPAPA